ncbi:rna-binding protein, putative [Babesia caballi]|uniref:Rna-binding protein, putative n=1 Tax=Babesia caballi TaxID=5871 RepID=A0AAV4M1W8_BABCB|nr:rna-binding protein, putative [Babesia caballi]
MAARRKQSDEGEDPRYKNPKYKSRKVMRKAQRKSDKQRHHQNMIQWKQRRKQALGPKAVQKSQDDVKITKRKTLKTNDELASSADFPVEKSADQLEIEYLERQLLKNRKSGAKGGDLFQTLRKEFVNDGFDEDFLDFLSSIDHMAAKGKRTSVDSTSVAKRMKKGGATSKVEDSEEDEEDDSDSEEEEEYGVDEDEDGEEEGEQDDESQEEDDEDASDSESDTDQPSDEDELDEGTRTRKKVTFDLPKSKETRGIVGEKGTPPKDNAVKIDEETIESVKKQQIGLINRISEGNFTIVVKEMINVYNKMLSCESGEEQTEERLLAVDVLIEDLCDCTVRMVIENENTVVSLVAIHTALICALCNAVGINVGYVYCHKLLKSLEKALPILFKNKEGKQLSDAKLTARNSVMSFAVISHLEMLDLETLFFLIKNMSREEITEHLAQILMVVLRYTGDNE